MLSVFKGVVEAILNAEAYEPSQFYKCQWQKSANLVGGYVLYRWIIASIFFVVLIAAVADMGTTPQESLKFFIYLTHWGFVLCTIQAILGAVAVTRKYREIKKLQNESERIESLQRPSILVEIYWIVYTMSVVSAFGITIIFWTRVYIPDYHEWGIMLFLLHGLNTLLMFLDVLVVAHPLRFMHFLWTFGFVLIYLFFSYIYYLAGGTNAKNHSFIYHSLNWENPNNALRFCVSSLVYGFVIHVCVWIFSIMVRKVSGAARVPRNSPNVSVISSIFRRSQNYCVNVVTVNKN